MPSRLRTVQLYKTPSVTLTTVQEDELGVDQQPDEDTSITDGRERDKTPVTESLDREVHPAVTEDREKENEPTVIEEHEQEDDLPTRQGREQEDPDAEQHGTSEFADKFADSIQAIESEESSEGLTRDQEPKEDPPATEDLEQGDEPNADQPQASEPEEKLADVGEIPDSEQSSDGFLPSDPARFLPKLSEDDDDDEHPKTDSVRSAC